MTSFTKDWHMGKMLGVKKKDDKIDADGRTAEERKDREKAHEEERTIIEILNRARRHFISRQVTGNIQIQYSFGLGIQTGSSISCDITEADVEAGGDGEGESVEGTTTTWRSSNDEGVEEMTTADKPEETASYATKMAFKSMAHLFKKMEWSSEMYATTNYKDNLQICRTISVSAQVLQLSISFTAPVNDLLTWGETQRTAAAAAANGTKA